ncbi:hypothetical protein C8Q76DRAFT_759528 [Earliella scabrosa]|nr:hypothetical protein C8Q76DRAFT_759528 [Earliella scabrosa]
MTDMGLLSKPPQHNPSHLPPDIVGPRTFGSRPHAAVRLLRPQEIRHPSKSIYPGHTMRGLQSTLPNTLNQVVSLRARAARCSHPHPTLQRMIRTRRACQRHPGRQSTHSDCRDPRHAFPAFEASRVDLSMWSRDLVISSRGEERLKAREDLDSPSATCEEHGRHRSGSQAGSLAACDTFPHGPPLTWGTRHGAAAASARDLTYNTVQACPISERVRWSSLESRAPRVRSRWSEISRVFCPSYQRTEAFVQVLVSAHDTARPFESIAQFIAARALAGDRARGGRGRKFEAFLRSA